MNLAQIYTDEFSRAYPATPVKVRPANKNGSFRVYVNGDHGDFVMSPADMSEAIANFQRGRGIAKNSSQTA